AGLCPGEAFLKGHHRHSPHHWGAKAAADVVFHDHVNANRSPISLMDTIRDADLTFDRFISYAGSEFVCITIAMDANRYAVYENIKSAVVGGRPEFLRWSSKPEDRDYWPNRFPERPEWRRLETEGIYSSKGTLRPHHVRVGRYFTLLDFCRSPNAYAAGCNWV